MKINPIDAVSTGLLTGHLPSAHEFDLDDDWRRIRPLEEAMKLYELRDRFIKQFGFAIPSEEALDACVALAPLLEVGAGSGYLTALLRARGVDVIPTDPELAYGHIVDHGAHCNDMEPLQAKTAIRRWPGRTVLMSWPAPDRWPLQALRAMRPGQHLIMIGEADGGCCANEETWAYIEAAFRFVRSAPIPVWPGLHDRFQVWRKRRIACRP